MKDKKGDSRAGSGRAAIFRETNHPLTYTFEANYCTGHRINHLNQRFDIENGQKIIKEDSPISDAASNFYPGGRVPTFNQEIYFDVG